MGTVRLGRERVRGTERHGERKRDTTKREREREWARNSFRCTALSTPYILLFGCTLSKQSEEYLLIFRRSGMSYSFTCSLRRERRAFESGCRNGGEEVGGGEGDLRKLVWVCCPRRERSSSFFLSSFFFFFLSLFFPFFFYFFFYLGTLPSPVYVTYYGWWGCKCTSS